nr:MAG TPA: hypothetical protein [Caudoviricetes sp.]
MTFFVKKFKPQNKGAFFRGENLGKKHLNTC